MYIKFYIFKILCDIMNIFPYQVCFENILIIV